MTDCRLVWCGGASPQAEEKERARRDAAELRAIIEENRRREAEAAARACVAVYFYFYVIDGCLRIKGEPEA